eukprot:NODE_59_length_28102_cov_0.971110.p10 type:complete len:382 gc:universal NODE_59_length_28102_cov_0.971110:9435-10580(+)
MEDEDLLIRKSESQTIVVFIGNIPNGLADDHMIKLLHAAGNLRQWKRVKDNLGAMRNFGFVHFVDPISVLRCDRILNNYSIISPLGIEGKLAVRIDEKIKKQLDRWIQDNPKDGNAQYDAPYIAKVSAVADELLDEKPMSYQLMNVEKQKTEESVRQIHEQRRKAAMKSKHQIKEQEKENLDLKFQQRLKKWQDRESEKQSYFKKYIQPASPERNDRLKLEAELQNWEEGCNHPYYNNRMKYLKDRRPIRLHEERRDNWNFREMDEESAKIATRKRKADTPVQLKKSREDHLMIPSEIGEIPTINWDSIDSRILNSLRPMILIQLRKENVKDEFAIVDNLIKKLESHSSAIDFFSELNEVPLATRVKCTQDVFRILNVKSK